MKKKGENPMFVKNRGIVKEIGWIADKGKKMGRNWKIHQVGCIFKFHHVHFAFFSCALFHTKEDYKREHALIFAFFVEEASKFEREGLKWLQKEINVFSVPSR